MADDPALIWEDDTPPRSSRRPRRAKATAAPNDPAPIEPAPETPIPGGRISLQEAHHQFGIPVSTLASWARASRVDAVKEDGKWMLTPGSVAARLSERHGGKPRPPRSTRTATGGLQPDGSSMLVPRDAWDKLMDQLGNLHEAGQMLAEARERAAKAETEATFLRERLSEMREERDELKGRRSSPSADRAGTPGLWKRLGKALRGDAPPDA